MSLSCYMVLPLDGRAVALLVAPEIILRYEEEKLLEKVSRSNTTNVRRAHQAKFVLPATMGLESQQIAAPLHTGQVRVSRWRQRYAEDDLKAVANDSPRGGRKHSGVHLRIVQFTTQAAAGNAIAESANHD